jgi:hypothetical protein
MVTRRMSVAVGVAVAALAAWAWVVGSALIPSGHASERFAAGAVAALTLAWFAMAVGAFGVGLLGSTPLTAAGAVLVAAAALAWRRPSLRMRRPAVIPLLLGGTTICLLAAPGAVLDLLELRPSRGDMQWHLGWIHQLTSGFSAPSGVYLGQPSDYPWLYHASVAWIASALPGGVTDAIASVEIFGLTCGAVAMWLLAREMGVARGAATWAVGLFLLVGAFAWLPETRSGFAFQLDAVRFGPFHGDPVPALTPSLGFLSPMIPRDLGLALTPLVLSAALSALHGRRSRWWLTGFIAGLVFLITPPAAVFSALWVGALALRARDRNVWRALVAAAGVTAVWLAPLAVAYRRYDGFASQTNLDLVEPSLSETLVAFGISLPLGAAGLVVLFRRRAATAATALLLVAVPAACVLLNVLLVDATAAVGADGVPAAFVRWLRYLPFLVLALCVPAGVAADAVVSWGRARLRVLGIGLAAALIVAAAGSTVLATVSVSKDPATVRLDCDPLPVDGHSVLAVRAPQDVADFISKRIFARTGATSYYDSTPRVRFRTWLDHLAPSEAARRSAMDRFRQGGPPPQGVNVVVVRNALDYPGGAPLGTCRLGRSTWHLFAVG